MRILMIAPEPFFTTRGTPISVLTRTEALGRLGHEIDLLTYHVGDDIKISKTNIRRIPKIPFIKHVPIGISRKKIVLDIILFFYTLVFSLKERYDCIHAHEEAIFFGVILKKILGKPLIYDMHSSIPDHLSDFTKHKFVTWIGFVIQKWILNNSDVIIAISPSLVDEARRFHIKSVFLVENIPLFEDKPIAEEAIKNLRKELKVGDERIVLYTGTFEPYQGLDTLLHSVPQVVKSQNNVRFILVGGEKSQIKQLKELAKSLNIMKYVTFTGPRPLFDMSLFMAIAHVLVSPRTDERANPPLKLYTYLKSKIPIVATNVPANTQVLTNETSVLADMNPTSFSKGIISILTDEKLRNQIIEHMKEVEFDYNDFLVKLKDIYSFVEQGALAQTSTKGLQLESAVFE